MPEHTPDKHDGGAGSRPVPRPAPLAQPGAAEEEYDAAQYALARARAAAKALGNAPIRRTHAQYGANKSGRSPKSAAERRAAAQNPFSSGRDPKNLGAVLGRLVSTRGWKDPIAVGSVLARWAEIVGPDIAQHTRAENFQDSIVRVRTDSTAWARQLKFMVPSILAKIDQKIGKGVVTEIHVVGPKAPSWRKGYLHVKGRGPRDTYG